jgi:hypothetical protein
MMDRPPASWAKALPDEMALNDEGHRYDSASLASERYRKELGGFLRALTRYCEQSAWSDRILGYVIYPMGEGATPLACEGYLFDQSPVMQRAFAEFLKSKGQPVSPVPREDDLRQRGLLFWPEAKPVQRERDYFALQTSLFRRYCRTMIEAFRAEARPGRLCGIDALKGNMLGWMTHPIFTGKKWQAHYGDQFLATGTTGMADILDWKELDLIATPHDYRQRWVGFGFDPEGIGDSVQLHGKIMLVEEDQRSYANNERGLFGSIEPGEEEAVLYRNLAATLSKGHHTYPMDVCVGYFESEAIQKLLQRRRQIEQELLHRPRADVPSVVMLVDDRAGLYTDFSAEYNDLAVIRQRIHGMNHCGVPTRTFLFDDLKRDNFPKCHKLFLLPNCYRYDPATLALLKRKLFRNGNVIVFGPGSGITDGKTVSADFATKLTGIECELFDYEYPRFVTVDNFTHPLGAGFGACETFGDTHRYGPVLVPKEGTRLGTIALDNGKRRPGLVVKQFRDYTIVFTTAVPLPARLLRNLARFSGTHVYDDEDDDVVYADTTMVAVHAVKPGPRTIRLPGIFKVSDVVTGKPLCRAAGEIQFALRKPVTKWWVLEKVHG